MIKRKTKGLDENIIGSLAIAILIGAQYLSAILGLYISGSESGYFTIIMAIVLILSTVSFISHPTRYITKKYLFTLVLVNVYYIGTVLIVGHKSNLLVIDYIGMCLVPLLCGGMVKVNYRNVLKYCMFMLLFAIPVFGDLFVKSNMGTAYDAIKMSISYAILPVICAGVLHFFFYRKNSNLGEKILYVVIFVFMVAFFAMSYRGALAALGLVILAGIMLSGDEKWSKKKKIVGISILLIIIMTLFLVDSNIFLQQLYSFLHSHNIKIAFIDKNIFLAGSNDISHGRLEIWQAAINGIWDSPLWGHGITTFQYYTGYIFPHNIVLQFLFDGGILLTIPLLWYLVKGMINTFRIIRKTNKDKFVLILLLSCISLTRVMVSAEVWRVMLLWLLLGVLTQDHSSMKELENEANKS